jgi:transcription antitermination factor NusG
MISARRERYKRVLPAGSGGTATARNVLERSRKRSRIYGRREYNHLLGETVSSIGGGVMLEMHDAFGVPLAVGDTVRIREGTFASEVGEVIGYHWRPTYPRVRLTLFGRPVEAWFESHQLARQGGRAS